MIFVSIGILSEAKFDGDGDCVVNASLSRMSPPLFGASDEASFARAAAPGYDEKRSSRLTFPLCRIS